MDTARCTTHMCALARVLFEMRALNTNDNTAWKFQVSVCIQRQVVLTDLIRLGLIGIEVVLAVEDALLDAAVQRKPDSHGEFNSLLVQHWQCTRKTKCDGVNVDVGLITKTVWRTTEQLGGSCKFNVNFEANNHFPTAGQHLFWCCNDGTKWTVAHCAPPAAASSAPPTRNIAASPSAGANT